MAQPKRSLKNLAKPLKPLLGSALEQMAASLESENVPSLNATDSDPAKLKLLYEQYGGVLSDECFGRAYFTIPLVGALASPVAITMCISDFAERECKTLYLCRAATELELAQAILEQVTGADIGRVSTGRLHDDEWDRLEHALEKLTILDCAVLQIQKLSLPMLRDWLKEMAEESGRKPFVVIDDELLVAKNGKANSDALIDLAEKYRAAIAVVVQASLN